MPEDPRISVVSTLLNDRAAAVEMFADLAKQTLNIREFVVVDGGSRDGSWEYLKDQVGKHPFQVVVEQYVGANVAAGRNRAIERATGDVILSTDFACRLEPGWAAALAQPFFDDPNMELVHGSWKVQPPKSCWQWVERAWHGMPLGIEATANSLGSSRSQAYKKTLWRRFGGYPEDLTLAADDVVFSLWANAHTAPGHRTGTKSVDCSWHRFDRLRDFLREQTRYGLGAGEALVFRKDAIIIATSTMIEVSSTLTFAGCALGVLLGGTKALLVGATGLLALGWFRRAKRWSSAAAYLKRYHQLRYAWGIPFFDVGRRYWWLAGYARGSLRGRTHCQECRRRLVFTS